MVKPDEYEAIIKEQFPTILNLGKHYRLPEDIASFFEQQIVKLGGQVGSQKYYENENSLIGMLHKELSAGPFNVVVSGKLEVTLNGASVGGHEDKMKLLKSVFKTAAETDWGRIGKTESSERKIDLINILDKANLDYDVKDLRTSYIMHKLYGDISLGSNADISKAVNAPIYTSEFTLNLGESWDVIYFRSHPYSPDFIDANLGDNAKSRLRFLKDLFEAEAYLSNREDNSITPHMLRGVLRYRLWLAVEQKLQAYEAGEAGE